MTKHFLLAALLLLTTMGCAGYHKELDSNPAYSAHRFRYYDLQVDWRAVRDDGTIRLSGTVSNMRSFFLQDLELTARLVNEKGRVIARESYSDFPHYIPPGRSEPFRLEFHIPPGTQTDRVHFSYYYFLVEAAPEFRGRDDNPHFGGFVSPP